MIRARRMFTMNCDNCGALYGDDDDDFMRLWDTAESAADFARGADTGSWDWTGNGEGLVHCGACPPLTVTEAALAERARVVTSSDVPLFGVEA